MLGRHMLGYIPSLVVPGLASFASLYIFTRILTPESYGHYVLAINAMSMLVGVGFFWLQSAASRLLPEAVAAGTESRLTATLYSLQLLSSLVLLAATGFVVALLPLGDWQVAAWFAPPLAILRALLNLNQAYHRNFLRIARYNVIEVGQALVGLALSIFLIVSLCMNAAGAALGTMLGLALMALYDWRMVAAVKWRDFDFDMFRAVGLFGLPFVVNYGLSFVLSRSDSFLIQYFRGSAEVGIYNAGYAFPDRIGQYLFMAVATASFPLIVRRLEQEGIEAAREQSAINGTAVLALAVPACVGLLFANRAIVETMIGADFRDGAARVMPWITLAMVLNGMAAHYFDHSLHLAKRTGLFFVTLGPAALLNFFGNLWAIPRYGYMGAAYTTLASYVLYLTMSIVVGARVFPIRFPALAAVQIVACTAAMAGVLAACGFPATLGGLAAMVAVGGGVYGVCFLAFDIGGSRRVLTSWLKEQDVAATPTGFAGAVVEDAAALDALMPEWEALAARAGQSFCAHPDWVRLWIRFLQVGAKAQLHIVTIRDASGVLRAVLPLAVRRKGGLRLAEWAGHEVIDFGDVLANDLDAARAALAYAQQAGRYDLLLLKDIREGAWVRFCAEGILRARPARRNYVLRLEHPSGEAWLAAQSRKLRGDLRRKTEKMQAQGGAVAFHVWRSGEAFPDTALEALYAQKAAWFKAQGAQGVFARGEVKAFLGALARDAAVKGQLYLAWLTCGDKIVACHLGFVDRGVLSLYHTTYDAAFGVFSPGNLMMAETIKWATDAHLAELDFMRGEESYKARFASECRTLAAYVGARTMLGRLTLWLRGNEKADEAAPGDEKPATEET